MADWRVDPDRVIGVLAGIDDEGVELVKGITAMEDLAFTDSGLSVDGRRTLSNAWDAFIDARRLVPGTLSRVIASAARSVSEATIAVVAGDEQMSTDSRQNEATALDEWGIDSTSAYGGGLG